MSLLRLQLEPMEFMANPFRRICGDSQVCSYGRAVFEFKAAFSCSNRVIVLGNGGSSSVASHISQDYMKFKGKKVSILSDPSMITMLANDFGYKKAYQKFLEYYVETDTLVIIMSSGGESKNMVNCVKWCEENNVTYGVLTGFNPNNTIRKMAKGAMWNYHIASKDYGVVECCHQIFLHGVV